MQAERIAVNKMVERIVFFMPPIKAHSQGKAQEEFGWAERIFHRRGAEALRSDRESKGTGKRAEVANHVCHQVGGIRGAALAWRKRKFKKPIRKCGDLDHKRRGRCNQTLNDGLPSVGFCTLSVDFLSVLSASAPLR